MFTGIYSLKKPGEYPYLVMDGESSGTGSAGLRTGKPPYAWLGREVEFQDLPAERRREVLDVYESLWDL